MFETDFHEGNQQIHSNVRLCATVFDYGLIHRLVNDGAANYGEETRRWRKS